ncbi:zinc finger MYM-type protein 1-like [Eriocheir sinensis]|uniref:zinc finger MYM-type protein 1-like n=1 Tax=Eriocheir sinensis TaxID=95602 RepID=UPI0021C98532|nr:zinc finger MYM-type protein 1-like [Eriocheir sinensis]
MAAMFTSPCRVLSSIRLARCICNTSVSFTGKGIRGSVKGLGLREKELQELEAEDLENMTEASLDSFNQEAANIEGDVKRYQNHVRQKTIQRKYFKSRGLEEENLLTWSMKEQLKYLHSTDPDRWTPEVLSDSFPISPEGVAVQPSTSDNPDNADILTPVKEQVQDLATKPEEGPTQPRLKVYPKLQSGSQTRSFQYEWYKRYEWLEYSVTNDRVYCFPCRLFGGSVGHKEVTFTNDGFRVWKKMHEKALKHGESTYHINAMQKWINFKSSQQHGNIHQKLDSQHKQQVLDNRDYVKTLLNIVITAAKSNMAFRGHDESENSLNKGIFLEIFDLLKRESEKFQKLVKRFQTMPNILQGSARILFCKLLLSV